MRCLLLIVLCAGWGEAVARAGEGPPPWLSNEALRAAAVRGLGPLEASVKTYATERHCFSCHHQGVPALAFSLARERGFTISEESFEAIDLVTTADLDLARLSYEKGQGQGGGSTRAGTALWALRLVGHEPDETTHAVGSFLAKAMRPEGAWRTSSSRPPSEASWLTTTAMALQGLKAFDTGEPSAERAKRLATVRGWLRRAVVSDTEDAVFRLWGLHLSGAEADETTQAAALLLETQNPDGGWSQKMDMSSDAYATGSALVALHLAGGLATNDPAYSRGLTWLLAHQQVDGTWHVQSRSNPFQPYFESGFPYGKDQFISVAASGWAVAALVLAAPGA